MLSVGEELGNAQSNMKEFILKLKGMSSIGSVSLGSIPRVPFVVDFVVMIVFKLVPVVFNLDNGGGGRMAIFSYNPWGFEKEQPFL